MLTPVIAEMISVTTKTPPMNVPSVALLTNPRTQKTDASSSPGRKASQVPKALYARKLRKRVRAAKTTPATIPSLGDSASPFFTTNIGPPWGFSGSSVLR